MSDDSTQPTDNSAPSAERIETEDEFDQLISNAERVLVDFYADWCGPCKLMASTVDELAAERSARIVKVDVEALPAVASRYDVKAVPTFIAFEDGEITDRLKGMQNKGTLVQTIE